MIHTLMNNDCQWCILSQIIGCYMLKLWRFRGRETVLVSLGYEVVYVNCKMQIFPWWLVSIGKCSPFSCDLTMEENTALILIHYKLISHSAYCVVCRNICDQEFNVNYVNEAIIETRTNVMSETKQNRASACTNIRYFTWTQKIFIVIVQIAQKTFA